ncbi:hypothetical protein [Dictyoglomus turgidum]|jgi:hypothetical protein|nr:hypothetical protein [Dictyoglomus turgidum]
MVRPSFGIGMDGKTPYEMLISTNLFSSLPIWSIYKEFIFIP